MSTPTVNSIATQSTVLSGDSYIDSLLGGRQWTATSGLTSLTYSFAGTSSVWANPYSQLDEPSGVQAFGPAETAAARSVLDTWARYANVAFTETSDNPSNVGDIRFAYTTVTDAMSTAHTYLPNNAPVAGDVWIDAGDIPSSLFNPGDPGFFVLLHEVGHALGLKHPFEGTITNPTTLDPAFDSISYTVMSYNLYPDMGIDKFAISCLPTTPMMLDIEALQYLYGTKPFNAGDTQYVYGDSDYFQTIYDTGGNDTIISTSDDQYAIIDLNGGSWSSLGNALITYDQQGKVANVDIYNVAIYKDSVIENAVSAGADDELYGNAVDNRLDAGGGHDILWGGPGADTLIGGTGNDHLYGQSPTGGPDGADSLSGGDGSDYLQGNAGNDTLDGGDGSDRVNGGQNDDLIIGGAGNDTINGNRGSDMIDGGDGNDSLRGGQDGDSLSGGAGNDVLSGDLGSDTLNGGDGMDIFTFSGAASAVGQPDRIVDFQEGLDRLAIGFTPSIVLTGGAQASSSAALVAAQQLIDGNPGGSEVAALSVGSDIYLFYGSSGPTIDAAIILVGSNASISVADFI